MIFINPNAVLPLVLTHKGCGGYVEQADWMKRRAPSLYTCPKCSTLLCGSAHTLKQETWFPLAG